MLPIFCCVIFFLGQALGSPVANQYIDTLIHTALLSAIRVERLEPTHLQDYTFEYQDKTFFGKVKGKAEYSEGSLSGLSSVLRYSECTGPNNVSRTITVYCTLSFNNLETSYKGKVKYGVLPKVSIQAKGTIQNTMIDIGIVQSPTDMYPKVGSFGLRSIGSISATFTGLGPLNKHMKVLEDNYKEKVPLEVSDVINFRFQNALKKAVPNVPLPKL